MESKEAKVSESNQWYLYILECKRGTLYTGITNDVERRFKEHKKKTAKYTTYNPPLKVVYTEKFPTKSSAAKRESQIKKWRREKKVKLIENKLKS